MSRVHVLWDESHIWGLLAFRALAHWGFAPRLVRASEVAAGCLDGASVLVVPGGRAKGKARALGRAGMEAVRAFVRGGGVYLGFCGGAGLALSGTGGLELCPWERLGFTDHFQHFLSGHLNARLDAGHDLVRGLGGDRLLLPVWWPAQFHGQGGGVEVLARYISPAPDFWVADLCLKQIPEATLDAWQEEYGVALRPDFLADRPAVVTGVCGQGRYVLSYSHLETPASRQANAWLAAMLREFTGQEASGDPAVPAWDTANLPMAWDHPALARLRRAVDRIIEVGRANLLLFWRTPWLLGWRRGIPGAALSSLAALAGEVPAREPTQAAADFLEARAKEMEDLARELEDKATGYLLAERLAMTVLHMDAGEVSAKGLKRKRAALFGTPQSPGGPYGGLMALLEELAFLSLGS